MDNEPGNVHRICHACHNRWHTANDPTYDFHNPNITPHSPKEMSPDQFKEAILQQLKYDSKKRGKKNEYTD